MSTPIPYVKPAPDAPRIPAPQKTGLYVHWPFCAAKCPYCDFNSHVAAHIDHTRWADAYVRVLNHYKSMLGDRRINTIFFGGGTPSLMHPKTVETIIDTAHANWSVCDDLTISLEANPTSVEAQKFRDFKAAGVNRVSMGVQSFNDKDLAFLGRDHGAAEARTAIQTARSVFDRYSFDLIYARPDQTLAAWESELRDALSYVGGHMSLYQLTIEPGTPFFRDHKDGTLVMPHDDLSSDFYSLTQDIMTDAGLPAYEVSNHAAAGHESPHNMIYWDYHDYIGIGPGAHGHVTIDGYKYATRAHKTPGKWVDKVDKNGYGAHPFQALSPADQITEAIMVGLRLNRGIDLEDISRRCGINWLKMVNSAALDRCIAAGWIIREGTHIRLTTEGILRLNMIVAALLV